MKTEVIPAHLNIAIPHAVDILKHGGLVAFPTDTVYGVAALVTSPETVERLFIIKGRNRSRAIAILIGDTSGLEYLATNIPTIARLLTKAYWPGPLTIVLQKHPTLPAIITPTQTVGIRIPDFPFTLELLRRTGPLAVTSANKSGEESPITAQQVLKHLGGLIHLIIDGGKTPGGIPSTVVDCTTQELKVLREGPITFEELTKTIKSTL
ncbi:MAG TPA: threonylcarbamoyl-AMP synthase [Anaerolineae bacterium]|nr:threonylcarbamoyl-AMP synthase [Anaerolineae bacterium]